MTAALATEEFTPTTPATPTLTIAPTAAPAKQLPADLSPVVKALETIYRRIAKKFADVPAATITVQRDSQAWGHTTVAKVWAPGKDKDAEADHYEIMISGERLRCGAREAISTLLHEAAHARNLAAGVADCDSNGRHNRKFADRAEEHGLHVENAGRLGWTSTTLPDETLTASKWHRDQVTYLEKAIVKSATAGNPLQGLLGLGGTFTISPFGPNPGRRGRPVGIGPRRRPTHNLLKATCGCGSSIRLSRTVLDTCQPTCQVCEEPFTVAEDDA